MGDPAFYISLIRRLYEFLSTVESSALKWSFLLGAALVLKYVLAWIRYYITRQNRAEAQLPPKHPSFIPFLGDAISSAWDLEGFLHRATYYKGAHTSTRISLLGSSMYIMQERETVEKMMKHPSLASPMSIIIVTLRFLFGMPETGLKAYKVDDSGPLAKPFPGSNPDLGPEDRIDYFLHQSFNKAFNGPGLQPTTQRFKKALLAKTQRINPIESNCWITIDDFFEVFGKIAIGAVSEAIYGPLLFKLHPDIIDDLWEYDDVLPLLARGIPRLLMPHPYRVRDRVRSKLRDWYMHARQDFRESNIEADGDGDPVWGSRLVRNLQQVLHVEHRSHDDDSMSSHDLALLWASNFNAVSAATLAAYHIFRDPSLLKALRAELAVHFDPPSAVITADPKALSKLPLLSSVYAETLRLYVKVFFMASSPHDNVNLGKWQLPKGAISVVSSGISHMESTYWNDAGGKHPLSEFWPGRFLVDPANQLNGPARSAQSRTYKSDNSSSGKPQFSLEGLDGVWIPYGGGPSICPGRFLAKNVVLFFCALLITEFDIEPLNDRAFQLDPWRYGLGTARIKYPVPVRIRRIDPQTGHSEPI